jgi:sulfatase modifying factor 1
MCDLHFSSLVRGRALVLLTLAACGGRVSTDSLADESVGNFVARISPELADGDAGGSSPDAGVVAPSCALGGPGVVRCGAAGESCCASSVVAGGTYFRTYDPGYPPVVAADGGPTSEADPATVSSFKLDNYLVTVGRFRQFVAAWHGGWQPAVGSGKHAHLNAGLGLVNGGSPVIYETGWATADDGSVAPTDTNLACSPTSYPTWTPSAGSHESLPINCVNWYEAYAFCIWDGGFLPSEAEWEYAAAGGVEQREYPWGTTNPGTSNHYAIYLCYYPSGSPLCTGAANIAPVGMAALGAGLWGQLDMAGGVDEWNLDWRAEYTDPCTDCAALTSASDRVVRGGFFGYDSSDLLPAARYYAFRAPSARDYRVGFRCGRAP